MTDPQGLSGLAGAAWLTGCGISSCSSLCTAHDRGSADRVTFKEKRTNDDEDDGDNYHH